MVIVNSDGLYYLLKHEVFMLAFPYTYHGNDSRIGSI